MYIYICIYIYAHEYLYCAHGSHDNSHKGIAVSPTVPVARRLPAAAPKKGPAAKPARLDHIKCIPKMFHNSSFIFGCVLPDFDGFAVRR